MEQSAESKLSDESSPAEPTPAAAPEPASSSAASEPAAPRRHPAAAADEEVFPLVDAGKYYIGMWNDHPNYGCPACGFAVLASNPNEGDFAVESHVQEKANQGSAKHAKLLEKGDNA